MFKCKECGTEYPEKPEYCDCGNDSFEEIIENTVPETESSKTKSTVEVSARPPKLKVLKTKKAKKTFFDQYPELGRFINTLDPISSIIFILCIIFSILIIFVIGNPKENITNETNKSSTNVEETKVLPSIDSFWNNSTSGIVNNEKTKLNTSSATPTVKVETQSTQPIQPVQLAQPILPITSKQEKIKQKTQPSQQQTIKQNIQVTTGIKPNLQKQQATQQVTKITPSIPKTTQSIAMQPKNSNNTSKTQTKTQTQAQQATVPKQQTTNKTTPTKTQTTQKPTSSTIAQQPSIRPKTQIDTQALKKELDSYKIGLRNTLGRKIDFTRVVGDGECTVSFKINSNGKFTNRAFSKQSSNMTLNDAVYSAVMATPSYNPPPAGYNNETMYLKIRFYSGNFDISLY